MLWKDQLTLAADALEACGLTGYATQIRHTTVAAYAKKPFDGWVACKEAEGHIACAAVVVRKFHGDGSPAIEALVKAQRACAMAMEACGSEEHWRANGAES